MVMKILHCVYERINIIKFIFYLPALTLKWNVKEFIWWLKIHRIQRPLGSVFNVIARLRKTTISFVMSIRPSVRPYVTTLPLSGDFDEIWYFNIFRKSVKKNSFD